MPTLTSKVTSAPVPSETPRRNNRVEEESPEVFTRDESNPCLKELVSLKNLTALDLTATTLTDEGLQYLGQLNRSGIGEFLHE